MFGKKKCSHCNKEILKKFDYCPYCANPLKNPKDYGLLGQDDDLSEMNNLFGHSSSFLESSLFDKLFNNAMKVLQNELKHMDMPEKRIPKNSNLKSNFQLYINGKAIPLPENLAGLQMGRMPSRGNIEMEDDTGKKIRTQKIPKVSDETLKKSAKLPRKEPKSKITRLKDRLVYELEIPGLDSLDKVLINKLENSIEIKAFTDKAVFIKALPAKLPLIQYSINQGKLFLEFKT